MPKNSREYRRSGTAPPGEETHRALGESGKTARAHIPGTSFAARFGQVILSDGIAAIPSALFHYQQKLELTAQQVWFVSYILAHKWNSELPYPSMNKMARCAGVTRRVLQYRCNELHNCGYLQIFPRHGEKNDQDTNAYDFSELFRRMEELLAENGQPDNPVRGDGKSPGAEDYAEYDPSFVARYGRVISKHGIAAIPRALFTHQQALKLSPQQVWFICYIFSFQWDTALPYPSLRKMAERTGYSRQHLINIKATLVEAGYLRLVHRYSENGQDTNAYDFSGVLEAIRKQLQPEPPTEDDKALAADGDEDQDSEPDSEEETQERASGRQRQMRRSRFSVSHPVGDLKSSSPALNANGKNDSKVEGIEQGFTGGLEHKLTGRIEHSFTGSIEQGLTGGVSESAKAPTNTTLPRGQKGTLPEVEALKEEEIQEDDSNQHPQKNKGVTNETKKGIPGYSRYIASIISDFSRELGDAIYEASNMKHAFNLWQSSKLDEQQFVELMYEAKKLTRKYQSRPTWDSMNNKMAYLFTTLRDLLAQANEDSGSDSSVRK